MDAFCLYLRTQEGYHATTAKNKSQRKDRWIDDGPYLPDDFETKNAVETLGPDMLNFLCCGQYFTKLRNRIHRFKSRPRLGGPDVISQTKTLENDPRNQSTSPKTSSLWRVPPLIQTIP
jgi:hypothetical protein